MNLAVSKNPESKSGIQHLVPFDSQIVLTLVLTVIAALLVPPHDATFIIHTHWGYPWFYGWPGYGHWGHWGWGRR